MNERGQPGEERPSDAAVAAAPARDGGARHAAIVAAGILASRVVGLVRQRVFAHYFGQSDAGDAFNAGFRIPNFLQNLFGEGVLSASFIPVYSRLLAAGDEREARRLAGAVASLLALATAILVLVGTASAGYLVGAIAPGFEGDKRDLTVRLVRILFPAIGLLVLSAWCLGILNSHRRFFLSYVAPVAWSAVMIAAMLVFGGSRTGSELAVVLAWAAVAGAALQFAVQLPSVLRLAGRMRPSLDIAAAPTRAVVRAFGPVFVGRGVVQISSYVDSILASLLPSGAVTALANAQTLYTLPVSLFGMAVSAAELPAMSSIAGAGAERAAALRIRLDAGLARIAFFIVPSAMAFLALGDIVAAALYQTGRFGRDDAVWVWSALAGSSVGLLAATLGRLYASAFYALGDTRTPLRFATVRVALGLALGFALAVKLPPFLGFDAKWGVAGLTVASGIAAWVEFSLLRGALARRIGATGVARAPLLRLWLAASVAAAVAWGLRLVVGNHDAPIATAAWLLIPYGIAYLGVCLTLGVEEAATLASRIARARG